MAARLQVPWFCPWEYRRAIHFKSSANPILNSLAVLANFLGGTSLDDMLRCRRKALAARISAGDAALLGMISPKGLVCPVLCYVPAAATWPLVLAYCDLLAQAVACVLMLYAQALDCALAS